MPVTHELPRSNDRLPAYPTLPSLTSHYSYLGSLGNECLGFLRPGRLDNDAHVRGNLDHGMEPSSRGAVAAPVSPRLPPPPPPYLPIDPSLLALAGPGSSPLSSPPSLQLPVDPATATPAATATPLSGGVLPDAYYAAAKSCPYDPFWMEKNGLSPDLYAAFSSKAKLEKMFFDAILLVGDKFKLALVGHDGAKIFVEATVVSVGSAVGPPGSHGSKHFPDLYVAPSAFRPALTIWGCKGPTAFCADMATHYGTTTPSGNAGGWKGVSVVRNIAELGERNLGSLHTIRQAAMVWQDEMEAWSIRTNQAERARKRRATRGSEVTFAGGVLVDRESGEAVEDQLGARPNREMLKRQRRG